MGGKAKQVKKEKSAKVGAAESVGNRTSEIVAKADAAQHSYAKKDRARTEKMDKRNAANKKEYAAKKEAMDLQHCISLMRQEVLQMKISNSKAVGDRLSKVVVAIGRVVKEAKVTQE